MNEQHYWNRYHAIHGRIDVAYKKYQAKLITLEMYHRVIQRAEKAIKRLDEAAQEDSIIADMAGLA